MTLLPCGCVPDRGGWTPNLTWITDDLAVGGRFPPDRVGHLAEDHGIGAVVDLRDEERDDAAHLERHGVAFLHGPTADHGALSPSTLEAGVAFARGAAARKARLLVHCQHGIGRSATLALGILVDRGFDPLAALRLAKDRRALVSPSPAQYACWVAWMTGRDCGPPAAIPDFEAFKAIAYRHLGAG